LSDDNKNGPLAGKVALVTGASSGIGEGAALALAAAGASVAVSARRADRLEGVVRRIEGAGGAAIALPGDVSDEAVAEGVVAQTLERFGRLDILVNSAGVIREGGVEGADTAEWRAVLEINLLACLYSCKAAIGPMRGGGDIINITSLPPRANVSRLRIRPTADTAVHPPGEQRGLYSLAQEPAAAGGALVATEAG
jgi:NAD(P)-dependent dehydrogenase (short-subunit alcohol dehydrogenase family)